MKTPLLEHVISYVEQRGGTQADAIDFFDWYESVGWVTNRRVPIKSWKAAARRWLRMKDKQAKQSAKLPYYKEYEP